MGLVQAAWEGGRVGEVLKLLDQEKADNPDLCGFEWNYWKRQCNQETRTHHLRVPWTSFGAFSADGTRIVTCTETAPLSRRHGLRFPRDRLDGLGYDERQEDRLAGVSGSS